MHSSPGRKPSNPWQGLFRVLPCNCLLCGRIHQGDYDLCANCEADLPYNLQPCQRCGLPLEVDSALCARCILSPPPVDHCLSLFHYRSPVDRLISGLKYHERFDHGLCLAHLLSRAVSAHCLAGRPPQVIVPVPLHRTRLRQRGFNQSLELARTVADKTAIPLLPGLVSRHKPTLAQTSLGSVAARRSNLAGAFCINADISHGQIQSVAILDDVITTMATINALAKCLRRAGVQRIEAWSIARASR